jgi:hypothetical protein
LHETLFGEQLKILCQQILLHYQKLSLTSRDFCRRNFFLVAIANECHLIEGAVVEVHRSRCFQDSIVEDFVACHSKKVNLKIERGNVFEVEI